ncbi:hypothetical protein Btru_038178 [Bulinus truncatus]|nr:hypothetical protein Btru_038178 [Bulinus truncatus]
MFLVFTFVVVAAAGISAAPLSSEGVKRQDPSLYGDPLTHDQILQLIKDHTASKRQQLSLYGDPLTHDQIIQLIKDHIDGKRQLLPLVSDPILHYQILQLLKEFASNKRDAHISTLQSILSRLQQSAYGGSGSNLLSRFQFQPAGYLDSFQSIEYISNRGHCTSYFCSSQQDINKCATVLSPQKNI